MPSDSSSAGKLPARLRPSPNKIAQAFTPGILLTSATTPLASSFSSVSSATWSGVRKGRSDDNFSSVFSSGAEAAFVSVAFSSGAAETAGATGSGSGATVFATGVAGTLKRFASSSPGPAWNRPRKLTGILTSKTFAVTLTRPDASCGSTNANGSSKRTSGGTHDGSPVNWIGGKFFRIGRSGNAIFTSDTRGVSETTGSAAFGSAGGVSEAARLSFVSHGSGFGFVSSSRGSGTLAANLNGLRTGAGVAPYVGGVFVSGLSVSGRGAGASGVGKEFGTDGPLEAGTLSGAGASVPFGENLKGIRAGVCGVRPFVDGDGDGAIFIMASATASGVAAAKASAVGGSILTGGISVVSSGSVTV